MRVGQLEYGGLLTCSGIIQQTVNTHVQPAAAERIAAAVVNKTADGWEILLEYRDGVWTLPALVANRTVGAEPYRKQLSTYIGEAYDEAMAKVLTEALSPLHASKHRVTTRQDGRTTCVFLATLDGTPLTVPIGQQHCAWAPLDASAAHLMEEDADFLMIAALHRSLLAERSSRCRIRPMPCLLQESAVVSAATAAPDTLPRVSADNLLGPALVDGNPSIEMARLAVANLARRLCNNPGMPCGVDLEGDLGGPRPRIALLQVGAPADPATKEAVIELVLDTHKLPLLLSDAGQHTMRRILEDPAIAKSMHCCRTDTSALYYQFNIVCSNVFDTGVADILLMHRPANRPRGLGTVLYHNLGEDNVHLSHKGEMVFFTRMFEKRPLCKRDYEYSIEDIRYSCDLLISQRSQLIEAGLLEVFQCLSLLRLPPYFLPPSNPVYLPCTCALLVAVDAHCFLAAVSNQTAYYGVDMKLQLAIEEASESEGQSQNGLRCCARRGWERCFGVPPSGIAVKLFAESRKLTRLGPLMLYAAQVKDCKELAAALRAPFAFGDLGKTHSLTSLTRLEPLKKDVPDRLAAAVQYLRVDALRNYLVDSVPVSVALGPKHAPGRSVLILRDQTHFFATLGKEPGSKLRFPYGNIELHSEAGDAAVQSFDKFAGPSLRKQKQEGPADFALPAMAPLFSDKLNVALDNLVNLGEFGPPIDQLGGRHRYFLCDAPFSLLEYAALFTAARAENNGFRSTPSAFHGLQKSKGVCILPMQRLGDLLAPADSLAFAAAAARPFQPATEPLPPLPVVDSSCRWPVPPDCGRAYILQREIWEELTEEVTNFVLQLHETHAVGYSVSTTAAERSSQHSEPPMSDMDLLVAGLSLLRLVNLLEHEGEGSADCCSSVAGKEAAQETEPFPDSTDLRSSIDRSGGVGLPVNEEPLNAEIVREAQMEHPATRQFIDFILTGSCEGEPLAPEAAAELKVLSVRDGILLKKVAGVGVDVIVAPPSLWRRIGYAYHDRCGHLGAQKVYDRARFRYHWVGMREYLQEYVNSCQLCPHVKVPRHLAGRGHLLPQGEYPFDVMSGDIYDTGLKRQDGSKIEVIDFGCSMSRGVLSDVPPKPPDSEQVCNSMISTIFRFFGVPRLFFSDHGSVYVAKVSKILWRRFGMRLRWSASYHHRTVGHLERWHSTLKVLMLALRKARPGVDVSVYINWLNLVYNSAVNSLTKYSPMYLWTLRVVRLPYDVIFAPPASDKSLPEWAREGLQALQLSYDAVAKTLHLNALSQLKKADLRRDPLLSLNVGQKVLLVKGTVVDRNHPKAVFPTRGPYVVVKVLPNDTYMLGGGDSSRLRAPVHIDRLLAVPPERPPDMDTYPVERIVGHRFSDRIDRDLGDKKAGTHRRLEYRLRWLGFAKNFDSWRSLPYLTGISEMVSAYNRRHAHDIPEEYLFFEEPVDLDVQRPPLSEAARQQRHFRRRPRPSEPADSADTTRPGTWTSSDAELRAAAEPEDAELDDVQPAAEPPAPEPPQLQEEEIAPLPESDGAPTQAKRDRKGRWFYLRRVKTKRGLQERWFPEKHFLPDERETDHFQELRDQFDLQAGEAVGSVRLICRLGSWSPVNAWE